MEQLRSIVHLAAWITIVFQLICVLIGFNVWRSYRLKPVLCFFLYSALDFVSSIAGVIMTELGIHTQLFYYYSDLPRTIALYIFGLTILHDKNNRKYISIAYSLALLTFFTLEIIQLPIESRGLLMHFSLFELVISVVLIKDRFYQFDGIQLKNDLWSEIALVILVSTSISLFVNCCLSFLNATNILKPANYVFHLLNIISVLVRYLLIALILKKFKPYIQP